MKDEDLGKDVEKSGNVESAQFQSSDEGQAATRAYVDAMGHISRYMRKQMYAEPPLTKREVFACSILSGLMANPERYKYIADKMRPVLAPGQAEPWPGMSQEDASAKNANKAVYLADALIKALDAEQQPTTVSTASSTPQAPEADSISPNEV